MFYTGDINLKGSRMLPPADLDIENIDLLITESTYSQSNQMPRHEAERGLIEFANEIMDRKGILFIPSFSVERSQEIACVLKNANFKHRIIMDGMALKVNDIILQHPEYQKEPKTFKEVIDKVVAINDHKDRKNVLSEPCVVISPAGMLVGGTAAFYKKIITKRPENGVALVSFQAPNTPGKTLWDKRIVLINGKKVKVQCDVEKFDFSSHSGQKELFDMFNKIKGNGEIENNQFTSMEDFSHFRMEIKYYY